MPLEAGDGFISGLVSTNPVNATDQVAQGDDHIRLIKTALKGTFPNLNGAVTASPAELNILDGATLSTAELNILDGATLNTAELNILDGVTLTAAQINDAARLSVANLFTNTTASTTAPALRIGGAGTTLTPAIASFLGGTDPAIAVRATGASVESILGANGSVTKGYVGTITNHPLQIRTNNTEQVLIGTDGGIATNNTTASEFGFKGAPPNAQNGDYTLVLTDAGKTIYKASGGAGETITIPANGSVAFPVGTIIRIVNNGGGNLSIAITTDTLSLAGAGTTGTRTLGDHGVAVIEKVASTEWFISGIGLS